MMKDHLPKDVVSLLETSLVTEFATVSAAGVPIDTPVSYFQPEDLGTIDIATGLSYPAKAERARGNPKVGLFIEGRDDEPAVSIAGIAAVCDADLQGNAERYIAETAFSRPGNPAWEIARNAVWYWTRMIVRVAPKRVLWWPNRSAMDERPNVWEAPPDTVFPQSDPVPPGTISATPKWTMKPWRELIAQALDRSVPGHVTVRDAQGFPLPMPASGFEAVTDGIFMSVPRGAPWEPAGKATLTFQGQETFVGDISAIGDRLFLQVERTLPIHPFVEDHEQLWRPNAATYEAFMERLRHETGRRGQDVPVVPDIEPEPAPGARARMERLKSAWWKQEAG